MAEHQGRRREDVPFGGELPADVRPGDYWKYLDREGGGPMRVSEPGNLTGTVWGFCAPVMAGIGTLTKHTVREHEDGTITVAANDGSSNSIKITGGGGEWHGYVDRGVWRSV